MNGLTILGYIAGFTALYFSWRLALWIDEVRHSDE